ncbi:hypothetical protein RSOLAG1IB_12322 [Rhizoctonia solani AG-1 IB]|uniref:Uncharacterized protein n=1 Tax=Thanatephorus cucumeris (strain AG1-IB / isolate 7/3/14) TaxID=1108050 RepID=A0A0B7FTN0_THACB|nr:hypothetical protein RSOLAG1IB_12322 [Rhizoctonia solani AG-1 IB]
MCFAGDPVRFVSGPLPLDASISASTSLTAGRQLYMFGERCSGDPKSGVQYASFTTINIPFEGYYCNSMI